jgi:pyruvate/2-oxoglutarate dehydrogenase complex dihydrolipoamide acyltransferase (E2) component
MRTGLVLRWLKAEGDFVEEGEPIMEVQTDKIDSEVEAPATGRVSSIVVPANEEVKVGTVLAHIESADEVAD